MAAEEDAWVVCLACCWLVWREGPCWRKAEMKEERKYGRCEGIAEDYAAMARVKS